ncbi:MAG: SufD family Fe-S cluster assembly protein [Treponema sp.]|nr:SufD family Fe-S cluster assembly protein [Treponema sp.]
MADINADVNQFPSLTWNHLNINRTHLQDSVQKCAEFSMSALPSEIKLEKKSSVSSDVSGCICETGLGKTFDSQFDSVISELNIPVYNFYVSAESVSKIPVRLTCTAGADEHSASDIVIHAGENSESTFVIDFSSLENDSGSLGLRIRIFTKPNATVHLVTVNMLGSNYTGFTSIGSVEDEGSCIDVVQLELGGKDVYSGAFHNLSGYKSCAKSNVCYVVSKDHSLDINYVSRQTGRETDSFMRTDGVVMDCGQKVWRGTIDFIRGCKDSKGDEQEDLLLLNPDVVNKTLPVILCGEEDVDGRHGSSVGRLGNEILFYMKSRGIDEKTAQQLMVKAKILSACKYIPDELLVNHIQNFVEGAISNE